MLMLFSLKIFFNKFLPQASNYMQKQELNASILA
jgi:hypothetical protein